MRVPTRCTCGRPATDHLRDWPGDQPAPAIRAGCPGYQPSPPELPAPSPDIAPRVQVEYTAEEVSACIRADVGPGSIRGMAIVAEMRAARAPDIAPREEPVEGEWCPEPGCILRPHNPTTGHMLRKHLGLDPAPAPSRAQDGKCGVCGGDPDDRHDGPGHSIHRAAPSGPRGEP